MEDVNKNDVPGPNKESVPESNEEVKEFEIIPEPKTMKELIVDSLVSSMNFFVKDINKKISDSEQISTYRLKLKIDTKNHVT